MADSEKVQDQQQSLKQKHQIQNHSDGVNGESTPDSVIQPKQTIGELEICTYQRQLRRNSYTQSVNCANHNSSLRKEANES